MYLGLDPGNGSDPSGTVSLSLIPTGNTTRGRIGNALIKAGDSTFNPKDAFTVSAHGSDVTVGGMRSANDISSAIRSGGWKEGQQIVLLACNVGKGALPAQLAADLNAPVVASTGYVTAGLGEQRVTTDSGAANGGQFIQFNPDGTTSNPFGVSNDLAVVGVRLDNDGNIAPITAPQEAVDRAVVEESESPEKSKPK